MEFDKIILGIDFGTTFSCVSVWKDGGLMIIPNGVGERTTPSVVIFDGPDKVFVGEETLYHVAKDNTVKIFEIKRILGRDYDSIINMLDYFPYKIVKDENLNKPMIEMKFGEKCVKYYPEQIVTLILKKLITNAEIFLNKQIIRDVILTVPADFNETQKRALKDSAEQIQGLKVLQVINEPSAAILAYGIPKQLIKNDMFPFNKHFSLVQYNNEIHPMQEMSIDSTNIDLSSNSNLLLQQSNNALLENNENNESNNINDRSNIGLISNLNNEVKNSLKTSLLSHNKNMMKIIVFDLGGGTYDVSLIYVDNYQKFETITYNGDQRLGGSDFDKKLVDYSLKEFCNQNNYDITKVKENYKCMERLKRTCEETKKYLSSKTDDYIYVEDFYDSKSLCCHITRAKFEELCKDLFKRLEKPLDLILQEKNLNNTDIDEIVLVGGSSKIPKVKDIICNKFNNVPINDQLSPDEVVAYGACIHGEIKRRRDEDFWKDFDYIDKTGHSLGIEIEDGTVFVIIPKGSRYPKSNWHFFHTIYDDQYTFDIKVYEGEGKYAYENELIGEFTLEGIPKKPKGQVILKVTIRIENNQTIKVTAYVNDDNNVKKNLTIHRHKKYQKQNLDENLIFSINEANKDEKQLQNIISEYSRNFNKQKTDQDKYELIKKYNIAIINYLNFLEKNYNDTSSEKYLYLLEKLFKSYTYFFNTSLKSLVELNEKQTIKDSIESFLKKIGNKAPFRIKQLLSHFIKANDFGERLDIFVFSMELLYYKALDNFNKKEKNFILFSKSLFEECLMISNAYIKDYDKGKMHFDLIKKYNEIIQDCDKKIKLISAITLSEIENLKSTGKLFNNENNLQKDDLNLLSDNLEIAIKKINSIENLINNKEALETKAFYMANIVKIEFLKKPITMKLERMEQYISESIGIIDKLGNEYKNKPWCKEIVELRDEILNKFKDQNPAPPIDIDELDDKLSRLLNYGIDSLLEYILKNYPYEGYNFSKETIEKFQKLDKKGKKDFLSKMRRKYDSNNFSHLIPVDINTTDNSAEINDKIIEFIDKMEENLEK